MTRIVIPILLAAFVASAQPPAPGAPPEPGPLRAEVRERVRTLMVWRLTEVLSLDVDRSARFFPLFNGLLDHREEARDARAQIMERLRRAADQGEAGIVEPAVRELIELERRQVQAHADFLGESAKVLTPVQLARLVVFLEDFEREMRELIRGVRDDMRPRDRPGWAPGR